MVILLYVCSVCIGMIVFGERALIDIDRTFIQNV